MDLKDKLRRFLGEKREEPSSGDPTRSPDTSILGGRELHNSGGSCYLVETGFPLIHIHGTAVLGDALQVDPAVVAFFAKDQGLNQLDMQRALFLDTETTGLAGGTGTYPFLMGIGKFIDNQFVVKQYLMRDYHEERAQLEALREDLEQANTLITFNGKSFDWPLVKDRFTLARLPLKVRGLLHLDLLYPARRFWRESLVSCSLSSLEEHILKVQRVDDIPGAEVPQRFFDYLKTRDPNLLKGVLEHNVIDIVSMVALLSSLAYVSEQEPLACTCPFESAALARLHLQQHREKLAIKYFEKAIELMESQTVLGQEIRLRHQLALVHRRLDQWSEAEVLWLALSDEQDLKAYEELAKYYEHRTRDLALALQMTKRGLALALLENPRQAKAFQHRLARLERKITVIQGWVSEQVAE